YTAVLEMKNQRSTTPTNDPNVWLIAIWTVWITPVVGLLPLRGTTTMLPHVVHRYATITTIEPQKRYRVIDRSLLTSTPMFKGTSIPRSASTTTPKNSQFLPAPNACSFQCSRAKELAAGWPLASQMRPDRPIRMMAAA